MIDLETVYYNKKIELQNQVISIIEMPIDEIKKLNPNTNMGFIRSTYNESVISKIEIFIDKDISTEMKLNVMFHEYGHARHWLSLGPLGIEEKKKNDFLWVETDEYEAFKHQLINLKEIAILHDIQLLKNLVNRLEQRMMKSDEDPRYIAALKKLFSEDIWHECITLIN